MAENAEAELSDNQFGYKKHQSCDAQLAVKRFAINIVGNGNIIAVSLDVANVFNSLSWKSIVKALKRKFP